jgi:hypothetical protein
VVTQANQLISDLVHGPFMNGLAQYGVGTGSVLKEIVIDTSTTPAPGKPWDSSDGADAVQLKRWLIDATVTPEPAQDQLSLVFMIFLPTSLALTNGKDKNGNVITDVGGWHHSSQYNEGSNNHDLFWGLVRTDQATQSSSREFVNSISPVVGHELAEAFTNPGADGFFDATCELGDICEVDGAGNLSTFQYRGWPVEPYWSNWDKGCIHGDKPVSLRRFLRAIGFDLSQGLKSLKTPTINGGFIASKM